MYEPVEHALILLLEARPEQRLSLSRDLTARGYQVVTCVDGAAGLHELRRSTPALVLLSGDLPDLGEDDICLRIRAWSSVPIIVLGTTDSAERRVRTLRAGADDYLVERYTHEELAARIEAVLRRHPRDQREIRFEDLVVDIERHRCFRGGAEVHLTPLEFTILETLARLPERVVSRATLASAVWPESAFVDDRLLDAHIAHLRRKLEAQGGRRLIQTVHGIGLTLR